MNYDYDKNEIKESISLEQMYDFLAELGAEPIQQGEIIINKTICHCGSKHKLYYYNNTKLFKCYTDCGGEAWDIFDLVLRVRLHEDENYQLPQAINEVATYFGFSKSETTFDNTSSMEDWKIFDGYERVSDIKGKDQIVELKTYDDAILHYLPHPHIIPWEREGIKRDVMEECGICYDPKNNGIVIPHYDMNGNLIGIRERTLVKENEAFGKYRPAYLNKQLYNHPLSFNLYNLNNSRDNIKAFRKAVVFEGEKSPLLYRSYFGPDNDISVASCGSSLIQYQVWLLISLGAEEIIVAFDKQFKELNDKEHIKLVKNLKNIHRKYGQYVKISYLFDKGDLIGYKSSPIDHGPEVYMQMFKERVDLY